MFDEGKEGQDQFDISFKLWVISISEIPVRFAVDHVKLDWCI